MPVRKDVAVILNPYSGRGRAGKAKDVIAAAMGRAGLTCHIQTTERAGQGIELAEAAKRGGFQTVVAAGGDGTVSEVMNGLVNATTPGEPVGTLALFPLGSGNDFADMVGYPRQPGAIARLIAQGTTRSIDLGRVRYTDGGRTQLRYFDNNMGVGLEAAVTLTSYTITRLQGTPPYVTGALRTLPNYTAPDVAVDCVLEHGTHWQHAGATLLVTIGNSPRTGGGFYLTPDARVDDGFLDVGVAVAQPLHRVLVLLPKALFGKHVTDPTITMLRIRHLYLRCAAGLPVQLDGEVVARTVTELDVNVEPKRLALIAPSV